MSEKTTDPENIGGATESEPEFEPILSQADFDKRTKQRLSRATAKYADYETLQAKASRLDDLEAEQKTQAQKDADRIASLETELTSERQARQRDTALREVLADKEIPLSAAEFIVGNTREEIEASADRFLAVNGPPPKPKRQPAVAGLKSGASPNEARLNKQQQAAEALRNWATGGR